MKHAIAKLIRRINMKYIAILMMIMAINVNAGYPEKIQYWYYNNVSTNVPALNEIIMMQDNSDGQGVHFTWRIENPPTKATIDAIDDTEATLWAEQARLTILVDYDKWSEREKAMLKLLLKDNNALRKWVNDFKTAISESSSLADVKTKVAALPDMPERTKPQVMKALEDELK